MGHNYQAWQIGAAALITAALMIIAASAPREATATPTTVDCTRGSGRCPVLDIAGDRLAPTPSFTGRADPAMLQDPLVRERIWMLYSHLAGRPARGRDGREVGIPHVSTRLARSDDAGRSWRLEGTVWDSQHAALRPRR